MANKVYVLLVCCLFILPACTEQNPKIDSTNPFRPKVSLYVEKEVSSPKEMQRSLSLHFLLEDGSPSPYPIASGYEVKDKWLVLTPNMEITPGSRLVVKWERSASEKGTVPLTLPPFYPTTEPMNKTEVIYPLGPVIPQNTLSFYAVFRMPVLIHHHQMQYARLEEEKEGMVENAWSSHFLPPPGAAPFKKNVFILFIHPGRVKRRLPDGTPLLNNFGPALEENKTYTITLNKEGFKDTYHRPLSNNAVKTYKVTDADRESPRFLSSESKAPQGEKEPFMLQFSEPMDYHSLVGGVLVYPQGEKEKTLELTVAHVGEDDSKWIFTPKQAWEKKTYTVELTGVVRDLAFNTLNHPFETPQADTDEKSHYWTFTPQITLP